MFRRYRLNTATVLLFITTCCQCIHRSIAQQQQSPLTLNGGSVLAMAGKNCVAVAVDKRFGSGPALVQIAPPKLLTVSPTLLVACTGLQTDVQSLYLDVSAQLARTFARGLGFAASTSGRNSSQRIISAPALACLTSHILYNRKSAPYYVEPLVIGLQQQQQQQQQGSTSDYKPYLCSFDMIGARSQSESFVCAGAASKSLYGTAEAAWRENLSPDELVQLCGQAFLSALERDCLSGYGALLYLITADEGIQEFNLDARND